MEGAGAQEHQVHCKSSLTSAFGGGLVSVKEAGYYKGWSEMRKVKCKIEFNSHHTLSYISKLVKNVYIKENKQKQKKDSLFNNNL